MLEVIKKDGWNFKYASDRLKNDREVVLEAVKKEASVIFYVDKKLKNDKEIVLEACKNDKSIFYLEDSLEEIRKEFETVEDFLNSEKEKNI